MVLIHHIRSHRVDRRRNRRIRFTIRQLRRIRSQAFLVLRVINPRSLHSVSGVVSLRPMLISVDQGRSRDQSIRSIFHRRARHLRLESGVRPICRLDIGVEVLARE